MIGGAFVGALAAMGLVMALASKVSSPGLLIVAGVMIGYICSAITDFLVTFADDASIANLHIWSLGSFSGTAWGEVYVMLAVVGVSGICVFALAKPIGAYQLGEQYAHNMGVNIRAFRIALVLLSSLLAACVTAFAGPISFVGVAVPHLIRALFGTSKPLVVIPGCFLGGAVFCLACDLLARTVFAPTEINISSVTAAFGAPVVIFVMMRRRR
jgi:iron complex transport system permease protein